MSHASAGDGATNQPLDSPLGEPPNLCFPRAARLRTRDEFQRVFQLRCSVADPWLIVYGARNGQRFSRIGLSVSRKVGGAVERNGWKRRLREVFRQAKTQLPPGFDFIVIPRGPKRPEFQELRPSLLKLAQRVVRRLERGP